MTVDEVREHLATTPFQPVRIVTSSGDRYEVRHPEMAFLTRCGLIIGLEEYDGVPSRHRTVSLLHITAVEPLPLENAG